MQIILKIKFLLLVACVTADTVMPLLLCSTDVQPIEICLETEKEVEKNFGEEKAEADKIFGKVEPYTDFKTSILEHQFFEHDKLAKNAYLPPILTPPPKNAI